MSSFVGMRRGAGGYVIALVVVGVVTFVVAGIRQASDVGNVSMVYLLAVIGSAVAVGRGPAIAAAVGSFLAFNFFFIQPHYTFRVGDDDEWVALALLLITGVITAQLAAMLRERVTDAERREKEAVVLYDVVRLMADRDVDSAFAAVAHRLRSELRLAAVLIAFEGQGASRREATAGDPQSLKLARESLDLPTKILGGGTQATTDSTAAPGRWIRVVAPSKRRPGPAGSERVSSVPIGGEGERLGSLILVRDAAAPPFSRVDDRLLSAVASQLGLAVRRLGLQHEANEAEALRRTDELRTALLNAVSHDLRTPLSSIIASAGSLLQTDVAWSDAEKADFARAVLDESRRLDRLVSNLLDLSRIEAGSIRPEKGWYDLASLCNEVAGRLRPLTSGRSVAMDLPDDLAPVHFDYVHIDQVLTNLIENAVKHTAPGAEIRIGVRMDGEWVEVTVSDAGPGVPPLEIDRIFKPFYRAADSHATGTGLGLAVAKGLVEANGGRIWVENRPDGGARFVFTLPLADQPAAAA